MNPLALLGSTLGLSFTSGINLYATVLTVGLAIRNGWVTDYPAGLEPLNHDWIIAVAGVMYACEFIADKIPAFDTFWDAIHTFIRPIAGAGIAFAAAGDAAPHFLVIVTMLGGGVATTTHITKAGARLLINHSPEPVSNAVVSVGEDVGAVSIAYLALAHPVAALVIVLMLLCAIYYFVPILFRFGRFQLTAIVGRLVGTVHRRDQSDFLPGDHLAAVGVDLQPRLVVRCFARRCGRAGSNRPGYLCLTDTALLFSYTKWFRVWVEKIALADITAARLRDGLLARTVEIHRADGTHTRFHLTATRTLLADRLIAALPGHRPDPPPTSHAAHLADGHA